MVQPQLGPLEAQFFAFVQMRKLRAVKRGDLSKAPLRLTPDQERKLMSRLSKAGLISRVWRGSYLVPPRLPLGGRWSPGEFAALNALMEQLDGKYQICGPNAFNRYGWDEQMPNRIYAYNNRIFGERCIGKVSITLIKVATNRLGGTERVKTPEGDVGIYASRARSLVDAVYDWSRFNSLPRGYEWIRQELKAGSVSTEELVAATLRYGDVGTIRRIGAFLERQKAPPRLLMRLQSSLKPTQGLIPWVPTKPKRGTVNRRWGVVFNDLN